MLGSLMRDDVGGMMSGTDILDFSRFVVYASFECQYSRMNLHQELDFLRPIH